MKKAKIASILLAAVALLNFTHVPIYTKDDLMGKFNPATHPDFVPVASALTTQSTHMRKDAYKAFEAMTKAAARDGIALVIVSGTRNYQRQTEIWTEKWNKLSGTDSARAEKILEYSSMPGTSRHHWGTDIDLNSLDPAHFESGPGKRTYEWLQQNAEKFGFFQPYQHPDASCGCGYREEKWHWSYFPTANQLLRAYKRMITYADLQGFPGAEIAPKVDVIGRFVRGIPEVNIWAEEQLADEN